MTQFKRKNAWEANNGGQFQNADSSYTDLYWYAKGVQVMQSRPIKDPTSWWFYAAIHGEFLLNPITDPRYTYLNWTNISYISKSANLNNLPSKPQLSLFWDQCQHGTWFFPPWHRGYLVALENILRKIITTQLNGPTEWALPYWNYLNQSTKYSESNIPPAFTVIKLPDGTPNPLFVSERYGLNIEVGQNMDGTDANDECQWDKVYESASQGGLYDYYYGGGETGFNHGNPGDASETGDLEMNPHNFVHGMIGGQNANGRMGLMGVPATAALDPVFYLHHSNIDRMWDAWVATGGNSNPSNPNWLRGPWANGNSRFAMPIDAQGTIWFYSPSDVLSTTNLNFFGTTYSYTYDDLSLTSYDTTPPTSLNEKFVLRMSKLGIKNLETEKNIIMSLNKNAELIGGSDGTIRLKSGENETVAKLDAKSWTQVEKSLLEASITNIPDEIYLQLEGVRGANDTNFLSVYVNQKLVKSVSLFGLLGASAKDNPHGGSGLSFKFNITNIIDDLHLGHNINIGTLKIQIKTKYPIPNDDEITVDRIGIYRLNK